MILGVDPKIDYAFKYLFGREVNRPILIAVLDSVLQPPSGGEIQELELQIAKMESEGTTREEIESMRRRMSALTNREQAWLKKIGHTLETFRKSRIPRSRASGD